MNIRKLAQYIFPHKINDQNHYGRFIGSFDFIRQLSWNLFHPNRIINRIRWKTLFSLTNLKIKKYKKYLSAENKDKKLFLKKIQKKNYKKKQKNKLKRPKKKKD